MDGGPRAARREDETLGQYRSREYAQRYRAEYTSGLTPKRLRSRVVAAGEMAVVAQLLREVDTAGSTLLDAPCGAGKLGPLLQTFPVHVVAAGSSREMLALAGGEYDPAQLVRLLECDVRALPFKDGSVDIVLCLRLFQRLRPETRKAILAEFRRVTRKQLLVSYSYSSSLQWIRRSLRTLYARDMG